MTDEHERDSPDAEDEGNPEYETDHNVYVLGAGFSRPAGLPLMHDFLAHMRGAHRRLSTDPSRARESHAIEKVLRFRLRAAAAAHRVPVDVENIETLFSLASVRTPSPLEDALPLAIAATLDTRPIRQPGGFGVGPSSKSVPAGRLALPGSWAPQPGVPAAAGRTRQAPAYEFIAAVMADALRVPRPRTTFITFNYDTILEDALHAVGVPLTHGFDPGQVTMDKSARIRPAAADAVPLLKLHGSINWGRGTQGQPVVYGDYAALRAADDQPLIVPPTWKKVFGTALGSVWERAIRELTVATRLVVVGFSFPQTDLHIRYLLASAFMDNISLQEVIVIDPNCSDPAFAVRVADLFRPELPVTLIASTMETVFRSADGRRRLGRSAPPGLVFEDSMQKPVQQPLPRSTPT